MVGVVGMVYVIGVVGFVRWWWWGALREKAKSQQKIVKNIQNWWSRWSKVVNVSWRRRKQSKT